MSIPEENVKLIKLNSSITGISTNRLDTGCDVIKELKSSSIFNKLPKPEESNDGEQHCSEYDTNNDGVVTVSEQKASIASELKNVFKGCIARFFKDDISYDMSNANSAKSVTERVKARIQNALSFIQYAKENNKDIFTDNKGTGVDDVDGAQIKYVDEDGNTHTGYEHLAKIKTKTINKDGTITGVFDDGSTTIIDSNGLLLSESEGGGNATIKYYEDGSMIRNFTFPSGNTGKSFLDKNHEYKGSFIVTKNGNYKVEAQENDDFSTTLKKLGITNRDDIKAVIKANPKAFANGRFKADGNDVYIPKEVIAHMKANGTYDEDKLMGKTA